MNQIGDKERSTQERIIALFKKMGYDYLGDWQARDNNSNIEKEWLRPFLKKQGHSVTLITRAIEKLEKEHKRLGSATNLYDVNKAIYGLLRYGTKVKESPDSQNQTVFLIDWDNPENNHFAIAEEVTIVGKNTKRPDIVLYVNGIAIGVLELKRAAVSVAEGIRQNLQNQREDFIHPFFTTMQLVMAGNDSEGLRYGTIETPEKHYLQWKEAKGSKAAKKCAAAKKNGLLDYHLALMCEKSRLLELMQCFIAFDAGVKKIAYHNQFFGVKAAQERLRKSEGGIIWHTQGSGKSLTMVWLASWIRENITDSRVLIITDRTELDEQIQKVYQGVDEKIHRTISGRDLFKTLGKTEKWLVCSLIHKFGGEDDGEAFIQAINQPPEDFEAKGDIIVFVDECHRTQSGELHAAMKKLLPSAIFIGFTGTPLLKKDKPTSMEVFGTFIHTYRYDEAVRDGVVVDLRYEARDIDQDLSSPARIDAWFEAKTQGLNDYARAQLKQKWGTMQRVLSSQSRLGKIVNDVVLDMATRDRLASRRGNALLVCGSIYEACKYYELFITNADLKGKCAVVTSYQPSPQDTNNEETGEGATEKLRQYEIYRQMLADFFGEDANEAMYRTAEFETRVKEKFVKEPGQMRLLIVVDKLLTGFDAPSATYLYIDKPMQDHGLFQAICRVNRLDGEDKEYGYVVDYRDLFKSLDNAISSYTSEVFANYNKKDVDGLLKNRIRKARERLDEKREVIKALCEPIALPKDLSAYIDYFCGEDAQDADKKRRRVALYKATAAFTRAYAALAIGDDMATAGYSQKDIASIREETAYYENARREIQLASGDFIDLKLYEPAMRHLIDTYIQAEESKVISAFDDLSLIQLIVEKGEAAIDKLPKAIRQNKEAVAATVQNNIRKTIIEERPINPQYYDKMSKLLDELIAARRQEAIDYATYLKKIVALTKRIKNPEKSGDYPAALNTLAKRAVYDNLTGKNLDGNETRKEALAVAIDQTIRDKKRDGWRGNTMKERELLGEIKQCVHKTEADGNVAESERFYNGIDFGALFEVVKNQNEYH